MVVMSPLSCHFAEGKQGESCVVMKMRICYLAWPLVWGDAEEIVILSVQCVDFLLCLPCVHCPVVL